MRIGVWLVVVIGASMACSKAGQHPPAPPPTTDEARTAGAADDAAPAMAPMAIDAAPPIDAAPTAPPDAAVAQPGVFEDVEGVGICQQNADCVLSSWQPGCCLSTCEGYAIRVRDLEDRMAKENCPPPGTKLCPPPAPCPVQKRRAVEAKCKNHRCTTRFQKL